MPSLFCERRGRWNSPYINHFISADTIVPGYNNPQSWNRYSYVKNNPLRYTDPTGHKYCDGQGENDCSQYSTSIEHTARKYRIRFKKDWKGHVNEQLAVLAAVETVSMKFASERGLGESASAAFGAVYGHVDMKWEGGSGMCGDDAVTSGGCTDGAHQIRFWSLSGHGQNDLIRMAKNVVHELGHAFDWIKGRPSNDMSGDFTRDTLLRPNIKTSLGTRWDWQQSPDNTGNEIYADMFIAWTYNAWNTNTDPQNVAAVNVAQGFMNGLVP
jgi:hypothetical protein